MTMAWGGFKNGSIPLANLVEFEGTGKYLQADAAASLTRLFDATEAATGARPYIAANQDLNRDLAEQIRLLKHNYRVVPSGGSIFYAGERWAKKPGIDPTTGRAYVTCATPGFSNHGWARAADISFPTAASRAWFRAHCEDEGWTNAGDAFGEDWHKEYHGPITTTAGSGTPIEVPATTSIPKELEEMAEPIYIKGDKNPDIAAFYTNVSDASRPGPGAVYKGKRPISIAEFHIATTLGFPHPKQTKLIIIPQTEFDSINTVGA